MNTPLNRRTTLKGGLLAAAAGVFGSSSVADRAAASSLTGDRRTTSAPATTEFIVDMAVLGYTSANYEGGAIDNDPENGIDLRGSFNYYEGVLYPGGSIPALP